MMTGGTFAAEGVSVKIGSTYHTGKHAVTAHWHNENSAQRLSISSSIAPVTSIHSTKDAHAVGRLGDAALQQLLLRPTRPPPPSSLRLVLVLALLMACPASSL